MESIAFLTQAAHQFSDWRVLLDILVFTLIIYLLYRTLRATGTWQIVIGLTITAIGAGVASIIGLRGVEWIFSNFSQVALIALLIIFQPEMRKILERTTSLLRGQSREDTVSFASMISDILFALAKKRWGGIIVIPGIDSIRQWISEGVKVDALPSFSLLMSIFDPNSPGHDGAVVITNGRVESMSVRLPLSQKNTLPEIMGTRHHASQGLSEMTDALIMTVSEERGVISFFEKGKRTTLTEPNEAIGRILDHGMDSANKTAVTLNVKGKKWYTTVEAGTCFILACLFWFTVVMTRTQIGDMIFTVPIQYSNLQNQLVMEGDVSQDVKVHLEGPLSTLTTLDLSLLKVLVDLSDIGEGEQSITLSVNDAKVGKKVKVLDIIPSAIDIKVKTLQKKELPVEAQLIGTPGNGFKVLSITMIPNRLQVLISSTSDKRKNALPQVLRTTPVYLNGLHEDTTFFCKIVAPAGIQSVGSRWPDIEVKIMIGPVSN